MNNAQEIQDQCTNILPGHGSRRAMKEIFLELAEALEGNEYLDVYGSGDYITNFEAEIAALFDSVYVSFYKDLGGLCGAMLMGSTSFVKEARVWQKRHGGTLRTQGPFVVSAKLGLKRVLPQINEWVQKAQEIAAILSKFERVFIKPNPPHVNMFHLYIQGEPETLTNRHLELAKETGTFLFHSLSPTMAPGMAMTEIHCWENSMKFEVEKLKPFMERLLE